MNDPLAFALYVMGLQSQQAAAYPGFDIFDTIVFWIVVAVVGGMVGKFLLVAVALRSVHRTLIGGAEYAPGPLGPLGPLLGFPATVRRSSHEIALERHHAYRKWGSALSFVCILGGLFLFTIGVSQSMGEVIETPVITVKNAAPGTVLFVVGFLVWRHTHK